MELKPYQKEGVLFALKKNGNCIIADEMGLGKTCQAITWMNANAKLPVLIVCPASLKFNWVAEIEEWGNPLIKTSIISKKWTPEQITIINYDLLKKFEKQIIETNFQVVIWDESQYLGNQKSQRTKSATRIAKNVPQKLFLSGTPMQNRSRDLFPILKMLAPTMHPLYRAQCEDYWTFGKRFCNLHHKEITIKGGRKVKVLDDSGVSNKEQLSELLNSVMIRRFKTDVLTELPPLIKTIIPIEESDESEERMFKQEMKRHENEGLPPAALIEQYRQYAIMKKLPQTIQFIKNIADSEKVIIGIHHREAGNELWKALKEYNPLAITGSMNDVDRDKSVKAFQNDPERKIIICSIKAAGVGLTLTAASKIIVCETMYTPSDLEQFIARPHRIGQDKPINAYYMVLNKSIDSAMMRLLVYKQKTITAIVDKDEKHLFA